MTLRFNCCNRFAAVAYQRYARHLPSPYMGSEWPFSMCVGKLTHLGTNTAVRSACLISRARAIPSSSEQWRPQILRGASEVSHTVPLPHHYRPKLPSHSHTTATTAHIRFWSGQCAGLDARRSRARCGMARWRIRPVVVLRLAPLHIAGQVLCRCCCCVTYLK